MAIISEHESPQSYHPSTQSGEDQPQEERDLVKKVEEMLSRAKRHRSRYDSSWNYNYDFVCGGRQWPVERARWRFTECVNITWASIMTEIAIQTDSRPKFTYTYQETSDEAFAKALEHVNSSNWEKYKWSTVIHDELFDCKLYHVAHASVEWNPELEYGMGDVDFRNMDPFYCYWDPRASDVNKGRKARYFLYTEPVPTSELKLKYPEKKDKFKPDVTNLEIKGSYSDSINGKAFVNFDPYEPSRIPTTYTKDGNDLFGGEPHTMLVRLWLRDDALEEICEEEELENGEVQKNYLLKKKYPKGRYIEMANKCILRDGAPGVLIDGKWVEYEDDCFPIARCVNYQYPREYAGENEVTHTRGPQKLVNYIWSYMLDMFKMQSNPVTVVGDAANVDEESITNEPGNIIKATDINQIRRESGTPVTPGSFDLLAQGKSFLDQIQGLQDVSKGAEMTGVNSGIMLEGYIEASQTRPRMKNRNLDAFLQDSGELVLKRMLQFYTQPRVFRITNKDGFPENIEFYIPTDAKTGKKVAKIRRFTNNPDGTQTELLNKEIEIKGIPDVRVVSGSALPYSKAQKAQTALTYFNAEAIDAEELLKSVDWPNYEAVLKRIQERQAAAAEAEAQQAGVPA